MERGTVYSCILHAIDPCGGCARVHCNIVDVWVAVGKFLDGFWVGALVWPGFFLVTLSHTEPSCSVFVVRPLVAKNSPLL